MRHCILFLLVAVLLTACEQVPPVSRSPAPDLWTNDAELVFQTAEALRYSVEQQKLEMARLKAQGLEGNPPSPR